MLIYHAVCAKNDDNTGYCLTNENLLDIVAATTLVRAVPCRNTNCSNMECNTSVQAVSHVARCIYSTCTLFCVLFNVWLIIVFLVAVMLC